MRDLAQELRGMPLLLQRIGVVRATDDVDIVGGDFPALALGERPIGRLGALARRLDVGRDDGVQLRIVSLQARHIVIEQLEAADLAALELAGEALGGPEGNVVHGHVLWGGRGLRFIHIKLGKINRAGPRSRTDRRAVR